MKLLEHTWCSSSAKDTYFDSQVEKIYYTEGPRRGLCLFCIHGKQNYKIGHILTLILNGPKFVSIFAISSREETFTDLISYFEP